MIITIMKTVHLMVALMLCQKVHLMADLMLDLNEYPLEFYLKAIEDAQQIDKEDALGVLRDDVCT